MPSSSRVVPRGPAFLLSLAALLIACTALLSGPAAAAKPKSYECQHPFKTGEEAVELKGISPQEACRVVRSLAKFESSNTNEATLYECRGATKAHPGRPVLKMTEFEGWKLRLANSYGLIMFKKGVSFRVLGQDFPINCS